jgi:hypothetical protein
VIIPLMQADATGHHWMTSAQFLNGVALGQITPGPVMQTVATVGYDAAGLAAELTAACGDAVAITGSRAEQHRTPSGGIQPFTWITARLSRQPLRGRPSRSRDEQGG